MKRISLVLVGGWVLGFAGVLLAVSLIIPSVAVADEINLLCGEIHVKVDPERHMAFGHVNEAIDVPIWGKGAKKIYRVTINDEVYMLEEIWDTDEGRMLMARWRINRITGTYEHCMWDNPTGHQVRSQGCRTEQCQKISGAPKF